MKIPKNKPIRLSKYKLKKLQQKVLIRDNFTCQKCGVFTQAPPHHKKKLSQGGSDTMENLETLCGPLENDCHGKEHR